MKREDGITLVSLIITIVVMLVIVGITLNIGSDSIEDTRLKGFYTRLEVLQKRVDEIANTNESYIDSNNNRIYIKEQGIGYNNLEEEKKQKLNNILIHENISIEVSNFRYFTQEEIKNILNILDIEYNVFIDFNNRIVLVEDGLEIGNEVYYTTMENDFIVKYNKNTLPIIQNINYTINEYDTDKYKLTILPTYNDNVSRMGTLKYKKSSSSYWKSSENLEIIIEELTNYDIIYKDLFNNTIEEKISIDENLIITKISVNE